MLLNSLEKTEEITDLDHRYNASLTFFHKLSVQYHVSLSHIVLCTEVESPRSLFLFLNCFLSKNSHTHKTRSQAKSKTAYYSFKY